MKHQLEGSNWPTQVILAISITFDHPISPLPQSNIRTIITGLRFLWKTKTVKADHNRRLMWMNRLYYLPNNLILPNDGASFCYCLPHMLPLAVTVTILLLDVLGLCWQDLGRPIQSTILQALQYAAKAHEVTMVASLTAAVIHHIQYDLNSFKGVSH